MSDHFDGDRYFNPTLPRGSEQGFSKVISMLMEKREKWPEKVENQGVPHLNEKLGPNDVAITFVNHATFLIQLPGLTILTDPVWSKRVSPFSWIGPSRVREPGISFDQLPKIDLVLISHNHYDHLDLATLKKLNEKFAPKIICAIGDKKLVESAGAKDVTELDWWQDLQITPELKITFAPTQHFSARGLFDRSKSLWGSYMLHSNFGRIYFGGDAGYSTHYTDIQKRLGAPDVALLGIGAYEPNWFMKNMHMNPAEAVKAHVDLGSLLSIGMHFGTFQLSAEGIDQPQRELGIALNEQKVAAEKFVTLQEGETRVLKASKPGSF